MNIIHRLIKGLFDADVIIKMNIDHTLTVEHFLCLEIIIFNIVLESCRELIGEIELDHLKDLIHDSLRHDMSLAVI